MILNLLGYNRGGILEAKKAETASEGAKLHPLLQSIPDKIKRENLVKGHSQGGARGYSGGEKKAATPPPRYSKTGGGGGWKKKN